MNAIQEDSSSLPWVCALAVMLLVSCQQTRNQPVELDPRNLPEGNPDLELAEFTFAHVANPLLDWEGQTTMILSADCDLLFYDALDQLHGSQRVDHIVVGGNVIHNTDVGKHDLDLFVHRIRNAEIPSSVMLGPRDTQGATGQQIRRRDVVDRLAGKELPDRRGYYHAKPAPGIHFLVLDSTTQRNIDRSQLSWLQRELEGIPADEAAVIFCHHMLFEPWGEELSQRFREHVLTNRDELHEVLANAAVVKMVCSSSFGIAAIRTIDEIHYVCSPALSHYPCAFRRFTVRGNQVEIETLPISEPKVNTLALQALREDPLEVWKHYDFDDPDEFVDLLRGRNEDWQATLPLR